MKTPKRGRFNFKPSWRLMEAIFFNTRRALGFDQWQLRDLQTESNSCYFCDFYFLLLLLLPFLIPMRRPPGANKESPTYCWCNSASPWGPGGTWPELWDWVAKTPSRGEGSESWACEFTPWEEGKNLVKGMESLLQLVAFCGLLPHTSYGSTSLSSII